MRNIQNILMTCWLLGERSLPFWLLFSLFMLIKDQLMIVFMINWSTKAKSYAVHLFEEGTKGYLNASGHMTKVAVTSIYSKNKMSSSLEPEVK